MQISYEYSIDDYAALLLDQMEQSPLLRRQRRNVLIVGVLMLCVLPAFVLMFSDGSFVETATAIWPLLTGPFVFLVIFLLLGRKRARQAAQQHAREHAGPSGPRTLTLDEGGITEQTHTGCTHRVWETVERCTLTKRHVLVTLSAGEGFAVPVAAFGSDEAASDFAQTVARHAKIAVNQA